MSNVSYPVTEMVVVPKTYFEQVLTRLESVEKVVQQQRVDNQFKNRVLAMAKNGCITSSGVMRLMGWSYTTYWRRVSSGELPMTKDGNRWKIDVDSFLDWHSKFFLIA
ncbi:MAG: hypothetical protein JXR39_11415 [Marinilabiliaceae bacterium]|nr:hypothetical protein [Marinilabiliaceae bacterium]